MSTPEALVVFCTFPDGESAEQVSRQLVAERLVACAQRGTASIRSVYRWEGALHDEGETLVLLKTTASRWAQLVSRLTDLHPYDVPQIVAVPAWTSEAYGHWLATETSPELLDRT